MKHSTCNLVNLPLITEIETIECSHGYHVLAEALTLLADLTQTDLLKGCFWLETSNPT
jgi:hypothetical protein